MRLAWGRYLTAVRADGARLAAAVGDHMNDPVPWCPGWVGRDVVGHTGVVHRHKEAIVAGLLQDNPGLVDVPSGDATLLTWYLDGLDRLLTTLGEADPVAPVFTWYSADPTVGFWIRRMAHETAVHRADAESTSGPITPLDPALAADGVDEVLGPIMCAYTTNPRWEFEADGRVVELRMADTGDVRSLTLGTGKYGPGWLYGEGPGDEPRTAITADASDLDLWSWGRATADVLAVEGDPTLVEMIRSLAAEATR